MTKKMLGSHSRYAAWIGTALLISPMAAHAAIMPGSVPGQALNFTVSESPETSETAPEPAQNFTFTILPGNHVTSGSLLLCQPGTTCDPADTANHLNWSDVVQWFGGSCDATGLCQGTLFSDPATFPDPRVGVGAAVMTEVLDPNGNDGVVYQASDGPPTTSCPTCNNNITTWTIQSDVVPEPATAALFAVGLLALSVVRGHRA